MAGGVEPLDSSDPRAVGPYKLDGVLGSGGMGRVYLGRTGAGRRVAVKVIRADFAADPEFRQRFRREAEAARKVARFCTAEVLDADTDGPRPYLVTEYLDGPTLAEMVKDGGPLAPVDVERVAIAVAAALTAIHGAGLVHRDLKPGNVVLSVLGPRVIDFGIARALDSSTVLTHGGSIGTPSFMAPEQALNEAVTVAADIFAWGSLVLFAADTRLPFGTGPAPSVLYRIVHTEPDLSGLHTPLRAIVAHAMRKNPAERPTARVLFDLLVDLQSGVAAPFTRAGELVSGSHDPSVLPDLSEHLVVATGPRGRRHRSAPRARAVIAVLLGVVAALAALAGVTVAVLDGRPAATPTPGATPDQAGASTPAGPSPTAGGAVPPPPVTSPPPDQTSGEELTREERWRATLAELDATRADAFEKGDETLLSRVYAPGSSALAQDTEALRTIVARGAHRTGGGLVLEALVVQEEGADKVVLRVTERRRPASYVAGDGTILATETPKPPQTRDVVLVSTDGSWRIAQILPVAA